MLFISDLGNIKANKNTGSFVGKYEIIGKLKNTLKYVVKCEDCAKDPELFKLGLFTIALGDLKAGQTPCGCSVGPKWNEEQQKVRAHRLAAEGGFIFLGWEGPYRMGKTYCKFECKIHGVWTSTTINGAFKTKSKCPRCHIEMFGKNNLLPEIEMVSKFFNTGSYDIRTEFTRSERTNHKGYKDYWKVYCPICETINESSTYNLTQGKLPCPCSVQSQKELYVNLIFNEEDLKAVKFGIARRSNIRLVQQNKVTKFDVENFGIWEFPTVRECKDAEKFLKRKFDIKFLTKEDFPDGYTETIAPDCLERLINCINSLGGKRL